MLSYSTIEECAGLLADKFLETDAKHIFIGDMDHAHLMDTMSCISHPLVLDAIKTRGSHPICVEMHQNEAKQKTNDILKYKPFANLSHEQTINDAWHLARQNQSHTHSIALDILADSCIKHNTPFLGIDVQKESMSPEECKQMDEMISKQVSDIEEIRDNLGTHAYNLPWIKFRKIRNAWSHAVNQSYANESLQAPVIKEAIETLIALHYLEKSGQHKEIKHMLEKRIAQDHLIAERIQSVSGAKGSLTVLGAGHSKTPKSLGKDTLWINFCPANDALSIFSRISLHLNGITPDYLLNAPEAKLISGKEADQQLEEELSPYISLDLFK